MEKTKKRDIINAARVQKTASITGVQKRYVRMVIDGDRNNDTVMNVFMELVEGENALIEQVKKMVPFNQTHTPAL